MRTNMAMMLASMSRETEPDVVLVDDGWPDDDMIWRQRGPFNGREYRDEDGPKSGRELGWKPGSA